MQILNHQLEISNDEKNELRTQLMFEQRECQQLRRNVSYLQEQLRVEIENNTRLQSELKTLREESIPQEKQVLAVPKVNSNQQELVDLNMQNSELRNECSQTLDKLNLLEMQMTSMRCDNEQQKKQLNHLQTRLTKKEQFVKTLEENFDQQQEKHQKEIESLQQQIRTLNGKLIQQMPVDDDYQGKYMKLKVVYDQLMNYKQNLTNLTEKQDKEIQYSQKESLSNRRNNTEESKGFQLKTVQSQVSMQTPRYEQEYLKQSDYS